MAIMPVESRTVGVSGEAGTSTQTEPVDLPAEVQTTGGRQYEVVQIQTRPPNCLTRFTDWIEEWTKPIREFFARGGDYFTLADWKARNPQHEVASCHSGDYDFPDFEMDVISTWSATFEEEVVEVVEGGPEPAIKPKRDLKTRARQVLGITPKQHKEPESEPENRQWKGRGRPHCRRKFR